MPLNYAAMARGSRAWFIEAMEAAGKGDAMSNEREPLKVGDRVRILRASHMRPVGDVAAIADVTNFLDCYGAEGVGWERVQPEAPKPLIPEWAKRTVVDLGKAEAPTLPAEWEPKIGERRVAHKHGAFMVGLAFTVVSRDARGMFVYQYDEDGWVPDARMGFEFKDTELLAAPAEKAQEAKPARTCDAHACYEPVVERSGAFCERHAAPAKPPAKDLSVQWTEQKRLLSEGKKIKRCESPGCHAPIEATQGKLCNWCEAALIPKPAPRASRQVGTARDSIGALYEQSPALGMCCKGVR